MNPISLFRPARLAFFVLLGLLASALPAQEAPSGAKSIQPALPGLITIDFPGGPLSKLATKLNEDGSAKLSIVQSPGLDPVLPAFSVRNVQVQAVVAALGRILESQGYHLNPVDHNLAVLSKIENARPTTHFASLQLARKVDAMHGGGWTAEEIIAAIQMGTEFANSEGKSSTLRFKYHPATKLLFVAGTPQEVDIAQRVFGSLPDASPGKSPTPAPSEKK
jgi:hypothetical protein